jgi:uncharacterized membrane protein YfcA
MRFIMEFSAFTFNPLLPLSGFAVGLLVGLTGVGGALVGVLVTILSLGAGALGVTALTFLYPNLASRRLVGSDIAHAALLASSLPGIALGARFAARVPERTLRALLASVLLLIGGKLILA